MCVEHWSIFFVMELAKSVQSIQKLTKMVRVVQVMIAISVNPFKKTVFVSLVMILKGNQKIKNHVFSLIVNKTKFYW